MRPNTALRELVDKLLQARPAYIAALRSHKPDYSRLVKTSQPTVNDVPDISSNKRQLRSSRSASAPAPVSPTLQDTADLQVLESPRKRQRLQSGNSAAASSSISTAAKNKPAAASSADVAACPICNRTFKAGRVLEAHVNRCIDNPPPPIQAPAVPEQQQQQQQTQRPLQKKQSKGAPHLKVPAKIAFHLFNDRKLRDKLKDVNLPITGKRKVCVFSACTEGYCIAWPLYLFFGWPLKQSVLTALHDVSLHPSVQAYCTTGGSPKALGLPQLLLTSDQGMLHWYDCPDIATAYSECCMSWYTHHPVLHYTCCKNWYAHYPGAAAVCVCMPHLVV